MLNMLRFCCSLAWSWIHFIATAVVLFIVVTSLWTLAYRVFNPPITYLMLSNAVRGAPIDKEWLPLEEMGSTLAYAAIASEDARFCQHHGFDFKAIIQAQQANERGKRLRGGSTISQQTAKNVFLWPQRSWLRKGLEAWFTVLIETFWTKRRIMEVYLNIVEWGPGVYGAQAASQYYFHKDPDQLNRNQAARLISILPSPKKWSPTDSDKRVRRKSTRVRRSITVVRDSFGTCLAPAKPSLINYAYLKMKLSKILKVDEPAS